MQWKWILFGLLVLLGFSSLWHGGEQSTGPPDEAQATGKLDYELHQMLREWKESEHQADEPPPVISVLVTLNHPASEEDLEAFRGLSEKIELQGAFGHFVQMWLPLPLLEILCTLRQVRSVSLPAETILD